MPAPLTSKPPVVFSPGACSWRRYYWAPLPQGLCPLGWPLRAVKGRRRVNRSVHILRDSGELFGSHPITMGLKPWISGEPIRSPITLFVLARPLLYRFVKV